MARQAMVTRTITTTEVAVMAVNTLTGETFTVNHTLPRTYKDDNAVLKKVQSSFDTDSVKHVHVISTNENETLYGMPEEVFIEHANVLPPRNTKTEVED